MAQLVVCCDGTWQGVAAQSNVSRLHAAVVPGAGDPQPLYLRGVGVSRNPVDVLRGGLTGAGLDRSITAGYRWLVRRFRRGDRISVFGFSRGAYTARSLAGMIGRVGLVDGSDLGAGEIDDAVSRAYARYRAVRTAPDDTSWSAGLRFTYRAGDPDIPVAFIGVWDTVGALGIPAYVGVPDLTGSRERYEFLDVVLNRHIPHARHAVALDELRGPFRPTLWRDVAPGQDVRQVWFPGDHSDVGGGHADKGLSDGALEWMMQEAADAVGLAFDRTRIPGFRPDAQGTLHGGWRGPGAAAMEVLMQPRPRAVPRVDHRQPDRRVAASAYERQEAVGYRRTRTPARPGDDATVTVPADQVWTATGLWLEPGRYRFTASGRWQSAGHPSGPDGESSGLHYSGGALSRLIGIGQDALRRLLNNPDAEVLGARRKPALPWMGLVAAIANEETDAAGTTRRPDQHLLVGTGTTAQVERPGYLHAFPNDAWGFYGNNRGSVRLGVTWL